MTETPNPSLAETHKMPVLPEPAPTEVPAAPARASRTEGTCASSARGSRWARLTSGLWRFLRRLLSSRRAPLAQVDPLNATGALFTNCEYVSRWGLVEFGVSCPRCDSLAADPGQFSRIRKTADGEAITCATCGATLLASPTTEKEEHLLPYSRSLHTFARKRHQLSPYSSREASEIRLSQQKTATAMNINDREECALCKGTGAKRGTKTFDCEMCSGMGIVPNVALNVQATCPVCRGKGQIIPDKCPACRGAGAKPCDPSPELLHENPTT